MGTLLRSIGEESFGGTTTPSVVEKFLSRFSPPMAEKNTYGEVSFLHSFLDKQKGIDKIICLIKRQNDPWECHLNLCGLQKKLSLDLPGGVNRLPVRPASSGRALDLTVNHEIPASKKLEKPSSLVLPPPAGKVLPTATAY